MRSGSKARSVGPYTLLERVGEGGFARVYRAVREGRQLAVKVLSAEAPARDASATARFEREIAALGRVRHPHLIELVDHGVDPELGPYMVTPLIAGMTLRDLDRGLCPEAALLLVEPVCAALSAMHDAGLVHRDLKPENVMVTPLGHVVLVDLGLALTDEHSRLTEEGTVTGSVPYMSPEQIEGEPITAASDVWSTAVTLYELVAGRRPFERDRPGEELASILAGAFDPLDAVDRRASPALSAVVSRALRLDPAERPADAAALHEALEAHMGWAPAGQRKAERTAVITDPRGYAARVAPRVIRELTDEARERIAEGAELEAVRVLDRALAYDPSAPEVLALLDRASGGHAYEDGSPLPEVRAGGAAEDGAVAATPSVQNRGGRRRGWMIVGRRGWIAGAALLTLTAAAVGAWAWIGDPGADGAGDTPSGAPGPVATPDAVEPDGGSAVEQSALPPELPEALASLPPLDPRTLSNDDPRRPADGRPASGEPLIPRSRIGGREPSEVVDELAAQLEARPDDMLVRLRYALALLAAGRTEEGLTRLDALGETHENDPRVLDYRALVAYNRGREQEAERLYDRAIEVAPDRAIAWRNRGVLRYRQGRTRDAYHDLMAALRRDADDVDALAELARIYEGAGRITDARPLLERVVQLRPRWVPAWVDLSLAQTEPADQLASVGRALTLSPRDPRAHLRRCEVLSTSSPRDAIEACDEAERLRPRDFSVPLFRGLARSRLGRVPEAIADLSRAIELEPRAGELYHDRALLHRQQGEHDAAREDFSAACRLGFRESCQEL